MNTPLAERLRPKTLDSYLSQQHLVGPNGSLKQSLDAGVIPSLILWGPPGIGKTTLATIIAKESKRPFFTLSAINNGVKDVRDIINKAKQSEGLFTQKNPILFIDEIHRFSKSQQDSLLGAVERGWVTLIGATTENPSFEIIPALLSRCQIYVLKPFNKNDLELLLNRAITEDAILSKKNIELKEVDALLKLSGGDARKLLNIFELLVTSEIKDNVVITNHFVESKIEQNIARYDKTGDQHYDIASAFIKSIRGSDPNGAIYWLARMIEGGEDVKFIARRLIISASEDIGLANPTALIMATNCFQAVVTIGYPEARIILSQCTVYLANSAKSNSSYTAINKAQNLVKQTGDLSVPLALRNAPTQLMKDLDYGKEYKYAHDFDKNFINQEFLPEEITGTKLYEPADNSREQMIRNDLKGKWKKKYNY